MKDRYKITTDERSGFFRGRYYVSTAYDKKKGRTVATVDDETASRAREKLLDKIAEYEANSL